VGLLGFFLNAPSLLKKALRFLDASLKLVKCKDDGNFCQWKSVKYLGIVNGSTAIN